MYLCKYLVMPINNPSVTIIEELTQEINDVTEFLTAANIRYGKIENITDHDIEFTADLNNVIYNNETYEYGVYTGNLPLRKDYLSLNAVRSAFHHHFSRIRSRSSAYNIIIRPDQYYSIKEENWNTYISNLPAKEDYDIIILSDYTSGTPFPQLEKYNDYYLRILNVHIDSSGIQAYIINSSTADLLIDNFSLKFSAEDYLNFCIDKFKLRVLVSTKPILEKTPNAGVLSNGLHKKRILLYNKDWDLTEEINDSPLSDGFVLTTDHTYFKEAVAVVFHMPTLSKNDRIFKEDLKSSNQLWVFWSMECELHSDYCWQYEPEIKDLFDITMTYKLDADVPVHYLLPEYYEMLRRNPIEKTALSNAFISSQFNQSKRLDYLNELMSYIPVHSYGKVLNNRMLLNDDGIMTKAKTISSYKFTLAFENAVAIDYVTEKFFHPLILGSVPVYLGAPNINDFAPGDNCFINVNDFPSVKALSEYLLELNADQKKYDELLQWKNQPFKNKFNAIADMRKEDMFFKLCKVIKERTS